MANIFNSLPRANIKRSVFDLSYAKQFTFDMGQIIPIMCDEVVPGDYFKIGSEMVIRAQPLVAPSMVDCNVYLHYFFVPYRILWKDWTNFITGGVTGPQYNFDEGKWEDEQEVQYTLPVARSGTIAPQYSVGDYLGFPNVTVPSGSPTSPLAFPWFAYNTIYNECYRNENFQDLVDLYNNTIQLHNYEADYFTTALASPQRGEAPRFPITGNIEISGIACPQVYFNNGSTSVNLQANLSQNTSSEDDYGIATWTSTELNNAQALGLKPFVNVDGSNFTGDLSQAVTFDINDVRFMSALQRWQESNARNGVRYVEFLRGHFGVSPSDARLQRPEYIGGVKSKLLVNEVVQHSNGTADSPLGTLGGTAFTADNGYIGSYKVQEYGLIMGMMFVLPRVSYTQGVNRQWLRKDRTDFYFPEFANLGDQEIYEAEIFYTGNGSYGETTDLNTGDLKVFGFNGRYSEMKHKNNIVCGGLRANEFFEHWHLGRIFESAPNLGSDFLKVQPEDTKRIFAVQDEPSLICTCRNLIKAYRPIPKYAIPKID